MSHKGYFGRLSINNPSQSHFSMPFAFRRKRKFTFRKRRFGYGGIRKRRVVRRRTYRKRSRATRPELKAMWLGATSNNFNTVWGSAKDVTATTIPLGTDSWQRIGRTICVRKLQFLIDVQPTAGSALPIETARLVVWRQNTILTNAASWSDLYDAGQQGSVGQMSAWGIRIPGNKDYTILYDKRITLSAPASTFATPSTVRHLRRVTLRFRKGLRITYSAGGAGHTDTTRPNHIWFNTLGEQGVGANYPTGLVGWKIWFTDV